ncbi:MAG: MATE family efflux transporter [Myxococcales bacterium]|nr:MATE family efflux transporter [Myxococcales bacterium]MCB9737302.1 MATE family efflux transporter [Deltaproteobacteria bacterium]
MHSGNSSKANRLSFDHIGSREVLGLAWPIIVSMLSYTAMTAVNAIWVAKLGMTEVAAVGLAAVAVFILQGFGAGVLAGVKITVATATGAGDDDDARALGLQGVTVALALGLGAVALSPAGDLVMSALGASPATHEHGATYFTFRALGLPFAFVMYALTQYMQGRGDTRGPMIAMIATNVANALLDPAFIWGFGPIPAMGVKGCAIATSLSFGLGALWLAVAVWRDLGGLPRVVDRSRVGRIVALGAPLGLRAALEITSFAVFAAILSSVGDDHVAAHVMVVRVLSVSFLPGHAVGEATAVMVGQAMGAGRRDALAAIRAAANRVAMTAMGVCAVVFVLVPGALLGIFDPTPEVLAIAIPVMYVAAGFQIVDAVAMVAQGFLNGVGDTRYVMLSGVVVAWLVKLPLGYALANTLGMGAVGAWVGLTAEVVVIAWLVRRRIVLGRWERAAAPARQPELVAAFE